MVERIAIPTLALLCCAWAAAARAGDEPRALPPDIGEVQRAAARFAGCDPDSVRQLARDVRALRPLPDARVRMLKEERIRLDKRDEVLARATDLYYERLRLLERLAREELTPAERSEVSLAADEATARLDALTGGEFGRMLRLAAEEAERARVGYRWGDREEGPQGSPKATPSNR